MTPTDPTAAVPITAAELAIIREALRFQASEMETVATIHRRNDVSELRGLAHALESRHASARAEAGRVEVPTGEAI